MQCNRCHQETTKTKIITAKKDGKQYLVYVCGTCKNGNYEYSFFPPKEKPASNGESTSILKEILNELKIIRSKMPLGQNEPMDAVPANDEAPF